MDGYVLDGYSIQDIVLFNPDGYGRLELSCDSLAIFNTLPFCIFVDGKPYFKSTYHAINKCARYLHTINVTYMSSHAGETLVPKKKPQRKKDTG